MKKVLLLSVSLVLVAGCNMFSAKVPTTKFTVYLGGHKATFEGPKNTDLTKLMFQTQTNGSLLFSVDHVSATNDAVVIDKSAAGQVAIMNAYSAMASQLIADGAKIAGQAAGAAK